ncbi:hypothetical protein EVAR_46601_1 [Eumeta japonica]|uniref:Uncharacterized protein n=1 Tax=Eumeta variegata TaxID=151549 RepID=A0A4C1Z571_EUMVA|nr:hypothetical protein EVAR_46601_1 [Eumeta japonica]
MARSRFKASPRRYSITTTIEQFTVMRTALSRYELSSRRKHVKRAGSENLGVREKDRKRERERKKERGEEDKYLRINTHVPAFRYRIPCSANRDRAAESTRGADRAVKKHMSAVEKLSEVP